MSANAIGRRLARLEARPPAGDGLWPLVLLPGEPVPADTMGRHIIEVVFAEPPSGGVALAAVREGLL